MITLGIKSKLLGHELFAVKSRRNQEQTENFIRQQSLKILSSK